MLRKSRSNVENTSFDKSQNHKESNGQRKGVRCFECNGFGHVKPECATYLKKLKKGFSSSWSEDNSDSDHEEDSVKLVNALTGIYDSEEESYDSELTFEELATSYQELCFKSEKLCQQEEEQKRVITQLKAEEAKHLSIISRQREEIALLKSKLNNVIETERMVSN